MKPNVRSPTGPNPEWNEFNPHPQILIFRTILISSSHLRLGFQTVFFPSGSPPKTVHNFIITVLAWD